MRSRTFDEDHEIIQWLREVSAKEARKRKIEDSITLFVFCVCFVTIVVATGFWMMGG